MSFMSLTMKFSSINKSSFSESGYLESSSFRNAAYFIPLPQSLPPGAGRNIGASWSFLDNRVSELFPVLQFSIHMVSAKLSRIRFDSQFVTIRVTIRFHRTSRRSDDFRCNRVDRSRNGLRRGFGFHESVGRLLGQGGGIPAAKQSDSNQLVSAAGIGDLLAGALPFFARPVPLLPYF